MFYSFHRCHVDVFKNTYTPKEDVECLHFLCETLLVVSCFLEGTAGPRGTLSEGRTED